jgi:hypothetical protein
MNEEEQAILRAQHAIEQLGGFLKSAVCPTVAAYYRELVGQGVHRTAATALARDVQSWWLTRLNDPKEQG